MDRPPGSVKEMNKLSHDGPIILWFRQDLRITDHAALYAASQTAAPVIPLFILVVIRSLNRFREFVVKSGVLFS